jgi:hypothetical protein
MGRGVLRDASEPRLSKPDEKEVALIWAPWPFRVGSIGDIARGVVECERMSSESNDESRGVIGRGIPGMYPGRRGDGDTVLGRPYGMGDER